MRPYIWASKRVSMVGQFISTMIDFLEEQGMDLSKTILIGHSLGAHVAGLAARNAQSEISFVVGKFLMNYINLVFDQKYFTQKKEVLYIYFLYPN